MGKLTKHQVEEAPLPLMVVLGLAGSFITRPVCGRLPTIGANIGPELPLRNEPRRAAMS